MTREQQEVANLVYEAQRHLNDAIGRANEEGLIVEVDTLEAHMLGRPKVINVKAHVLLPVPEKR